MVGLLQRPRRACEGGFVCNRAARFLVWMNSKGGRTRVAGGQGQNSRKGDRSHKARKRHRVYPGCLVCCEKSNTGPKLEETQFGGIWICCLFSTKKPAKGAGFESCDRAKLSAASDPSRRPRRPCAPRNPIRCHTTPSRAPCVCPRPWSGRARRLSFGWCG